MREAEEEYRRLLYVAMTRAADRLVVAGSRGENRIPPGCWYELVEKALKPEAIEEAAVDGDGTVWRWRKPAEDETASAPEPAVPAAAQTDLPEWLKRNAPAAFAPRAIAPSAASAPKFADRHALLRGRIVHRLLQALPAIPAEKRAAAARQHLARANDLSEAERETIAREVMAVIGDPQFASLFARRLARRSADRRRSFIRRARVRPGRPAGGHRAGCVDRRLQIRPHRAARTEDIPPGYVRQLALYRAVLTSLYPNHQVRAVLVWTAGPALTELPADALDAALSSVTARTNT